MTKFIFSMCIAITFPRSYWCWLGASKEGENLERIVKTKKTSNRRQEDDLQLGHWGKLDMDRPLEHRQMLDFIGWGHKLEKLGNAIAV